MSKRVEKLLKLTVGDVREQLAHMESDLGIKEWLYDYAELPDEDDDLLSGLCDDEDDDDCCDDDYDDEDYDDEDEDEDEDEIEVGGSLPNPDEEALANEIANDIRNRRYSINSLAGLYSAEFIIRVQDLLR